MIADKNWGAGLFKTEEGGRDVLTDLNGGPEIPLWISRRSNA